MKKKMLPELRPDRYINPYTDFGFKMLFGTELNKELLISFVNSLFNGQEIVKDLTYLNAEQLGSTEVDRRAIFDVFCENEKGEKILIEMQRGEQQFFKDRSLYYSTFPICDYGKKGEWDYQLKAVYVIGILNFIFDDSHDNYFHHKVKLMDTHSKEVFYDKLTLKKLPICPLYKIARYRAVFVIERLYLRKVNSSSFKINSTCSYLYGNLCIFLLDYSKIVTFV